MIINGTIYAPFTRDQQDALNRFQASGTFHPFTCANDGTPLYAGEMWRCRRCTYTQDWAHAFMADGSVT